MASRLLVASNNPHKLVEFRRILEPLGFELVSPADLSLALEVEETGRTFAENALLKAGAFHELSGLPAVADDSGIVVDALGGEPGIYSARYGGPGLSDPDRTQLLLDRMRDVPAGSRAARFVAAVALVGERPQPVAFEGKVEGRIASRAEGSNGFGYDPIFFYPPFGQTFGQVPSAMKDQVSHRSRALHALAHYLRTHIGAGIIEQSEGPAR